MDGPSRPGRSSGRRLLILLTIALVGYEVALYRHWFEFVPLVPTKTVALEPDQSPIGFVQSGHFVIGRNRLLGQGATVLGGPVELLRFPSAEFARDLPAFEDRILSELPMQESGYPRSHDDIADLLRQLRVKMMYESGQIEEEIMRYERVAMEEATPPAAHPGRNSMYGGSTYYILDDRRLVYLEQNALHCLDWTTGQLKWTKSGLRAVLHVSGDWACVIKGATDGWWTTRSPVDFAILNLRDATLLDGIAPDRPFDIVGISPDRRWIVYLLHDGFEAWSLLERRRAWFIDFKEARTRQLSFSKDSQFLVDWTLDEDGQLYESRIRIADGHVETAAKRPDSGEPNYAAKAILGDRFALFQNVRSNVRRESDLVRWFNNVARSLRLAVTSSPKPIQRIALVFDTKSRDFVGTIDQTFAELFAVPNEQALVVFRRPQGPGPNRLEYYAMPPRKDWVWLAVCGIGLPVALLLLSWSVRVWHRRRHRSQQLAGPLPDDKGFGG